jgi:hypothetical protein
MELGPVGRKDELVSRCVRNWGIPMSMRLTRTLVASLTVFVLGALAVVVQSAKSVAAPGTTVIHLLGRQTGARILPLGGDSNFSTPGNEIIAADDLLDPKTHKKVGVDSLVLQVGLDGRLLLINGTEHLIGRGDVTLAGRFGPSASSTFAVVGGTGEFAGARGTATDVATADDQPDRLTLRLLH